MPKLSDLLRPNYGGGKHTVRLERVKREGSEPFVWAVPATATTAYSYIKVSNQFPLARKYEPLDFIEIVNNENSNGLLIYINGRMGEVFTMPAKTMRTAEGLHIWSVEVYNEGLTTTTLNAVRITLQKLPLTQPYQVSRGEM
jgi:hypothetical protein